MLQTLSKILLLSFSLLSATLAWGIGVDDILSFKEAPSGVVFEIVSGETGLLSKLLPTVKADIERLRKRYPKLPVAIVTHGTEQFDLTSKNQKKENKAHEIVEQLVKSAEVDVHVCGTHAEWYNVSPEDFPEYVDVSPTGPSQINDYEEMGYLLVVLP